MKVEPRRVAVVGVAGLSPAGAGIEACRAWLSKDPPDNGGQQIPDFDPQNYLSNAKLLRSMHRTFQIAAAAASLAMRAAELPAAEALATQRVRPERAGVAAALADMTPLTSDVLSVLKQARTGHDAEPVDWARFAEISLHELHPFRRLTLLANMSTAHTSLLFGLQGPSFTFTTGARAGIQTLEESYWSIGLDRADLMVCQSADSPEQTFSAWPRPEIAAAVVLEDWDQAQRRGVKIMAELIAEGAVTEIEDGASVQAREESEAAPTLPLLEAAVRLGTRPQLRAGAVERVSLAALADRGRIWARREAAVL